MRLFLALQAGGGYFYNEAVDLTGETGGLLLRLALRTGRLYLDGLVELPLQSGAARPLKLSWTHNLTGLQQLAFDLPAPLQMIPTWPPFYLDTAAGVVGELQSDLSAHLLQQLMAAPPLNEADAPLVRERLSQLAQTRQLALPLPDAPEAVAAGTPAARLVLTQGRFRHLAMGRLHDDLALAVLYFDYPQDMTVVGVERPPSFMRQRLGGEWQTLQRDLATESAIWQQVRAVGLESWQRRLDNYQRFEGTEDGLMPQRNDAVGWMSFLNEGVPELERQGVPVVFADDFPYCIAQAEDWFVAVEESVGSDWFDLDLGVSVAGERVSLVPPLLRLLREQPDLLGIVRGLEDEPELSGGTRCAPHPAGTGRASEGVAAAPAGVSRRGPAAPVATQRRGAGRAGEPAGTMDRRRGIARTGPTPERFFGHDAPCPGARVHGNPAPLSAGWPGLAAVPARISAWPASLPTTWAWARRYRRWLTCIWKRRRAGRIDRVWWWPRPA